MKTIIYPQVLSINWLQERYEQKEITPRDVVQEIIRRADEDADMNIWITPPSMKSIEPYLDQLGSLDPTKAPLWGIPFAIKDNIDLAGVPTTAGCPEFAYLPDSHAAVVARLIAAGAIPVGKTNLDQFATGLVGTRSPYGETHNSLRPELISGGSSSGSAVAVARGQAAFSLGTDTAGSGRVPAAFNNLVGFKPSLGAWSTKGVVPACASLDCVTVFTHYLEDALAVDRVVRGKEETDPWSRNVLPVDRKLPKKICLPKEELEFFGPFADEYRAAWNKAVQRVEELGISVQYVDVEMFKQAAKILYDGPMVAERWAGLGEFVESHPDATFPVTEQVLRSGAASGYDAASVFKAQHTLQNLKLKARELLQDAVLMMPTTGGTWNREQVLQDPIATNSAMGLYTNHCNLLDLCAISIPAGEALKDTPFGVTMFALAQNEGHVFAAAELFLHDALKPKASPVETDKSTTLVAICGLHMRGFALEKQMIECGAHFIREALSAPKYQLVKLPTIPAKPGMIKQHTGGSSIELEIWEMPLKFFGNFTAAIPGPLGIGKVELLDGTMVPGFICEAYAAEDAEDITEFGGWRNLTK